MLRRIAATASIAGALGLAAIGFGAAPAQADDEWWWWWDPPPPEDTSVEMGWRTAWTYQPLGRRPARPLGQAVEVVQVAAQDDRQQYAYVCARMASFDVAGGRG